MKDARGHGSDSRGGAAHQTGVNSISADDRKWYTPLGIQTLRHVGSAGHDENGVWKNTYLNAARDMHSYS